MSRGFVLILACCASLFSFSVQASPILLPMQKTAPDITLVRGFCGLGFHRGPYGYCMRNGTVACASGGGGAIARRSRAIACSSRAIDSGCGSGGAGSGCPDGVPLRLLPWSLRPLFAELLLKGRSRRPTFHSHTSLDNQPL